MDSVEISDCYVKCHAWYFGKSTTFYYLYLINTTIIGGIFVSRYFNNIGKLRGLL